MSKNRCIHLEHGHVEELNQAGGLVLGVSNKREEEVKGQFSVDARHGSETRKSCCRDGHKGHGASDWQDAASSRQQELQETSNMNHLD